MSRRSESEARIAAHAKLDGARRGPQEPGAAVLAPDTPISRAVAGLDETDRPARLGRFVILECLGQGGMGVVYSAYDPKLDRRVALKLIRPSGDGRLARTGRNRLLREAQALARLSHPNIVPVHDVGVILDQVFVVMEFVDGQTLRTFTRSKERSWREILAVYRQAGEGLAAAHRLGVVHRDFKPDNAIVGDDLRVRVIDFGLARAFRDEDVTGNHGVLDAAGEVSQKALDIDGSISPYDSTRLQIANQPSIAHAETRAETPRAEHQDHDSLQLDDTVTATRAVLGTPAYMPPEQYVSARVGPATDQFSFCVSLYEALYGQRPFAGNTADEIRVNMRAGIIRPPGKNSSVPGRIHTVLCRGLRADPAERYPSMQALLADLARDSTRTRQLLALAAVLVTALMLGGYTVLRSTQASVAVCQGADEAIARVWNPERRAMIEDAFLRTKSPYAHESLGQVLATLDRYAAEWTALHTDACMSHQRGQQSGDLLDRRMGCLERRLQAMDSTTAVLAEATASSLPNMVEVVQRLAPLDDCANSEALMAEIPPPDSPDLAREVARQRQHLLRVEALEYSGRYHDALTEVTTIVTSAEALAYRPLLAEALLVNGRVLIRMGRRNEAAKSLERAALAALAVNLETVGVEAIARLVYVGGTTEGSEHQGSLVLVPYAESLLERIPQSTFAHGLLLNNTGIVYMARGERDKAQSYFERALAIKESDPDARHIELIHILQNLAMVTPDEERRRKLMEQAMREFDQELGESHPMSLSLRLIYSRYVPSPAQARDILAPVCYRYEQFHPDLHEKRIDCLSQLGFFYGELGDARRASAHLGKAAGFSTVLPDVWNKALIQLTRGYSLYYQGKHQAALRALAEARTLYTGFPDKWWWRWRGAEADMGVGLAYFALGRQKEAISPLEAALRELEDLSQLHQDSVLDRELALAQLSLGKALITRSRDARVCNERALELLGQAEARYRSASQGVEFRLDDIAQHRRELQAACK